MVRNLDFSVSVIIPVYNGEKFLVEAIHNIQNQNYQNLEIIIIDDGSTDQTAEIVAQIQGNIHYKYQVHAGVSAARNLGINMAGGDVIAFLDADDLWKDDSLKTQLQALAMNPSVDIVQGLIQEMQFNQDELIFVMSSEPYQFINLGSAIYRRAVFDRVGEFNESLDHAEDVEWFFRAWKHNIKKLVLDKVTLFYRKHDSNMTLNYNNLDYSGFLRILKTNINMSRKEGNILKPWNFNEFKKYAGEPPLRKN